MEQTAYINNWKVYHNNLDENVAKSCKAEIERILGISQSAFYRKLKAPDKFLSIAEKRAIARVYHLKEAYLFPELEVGPGVGN